MTRSRVGCHVATCLALGGFLLATIAEAAIYKAIDTDGTTVYTDRPNAGAKRIELPPLPTARAIAFSSPAVQAKSSIASATATYRDVSIVTPVHDAALRNNAGALAVELTVAPKLEPTHTITILLDGKPFHRRARTTALTLANVDRGTHALQARIVDSSGRELARSVSVTFHLQRFSILNAPNR